MLRLREIAGALNTSLVGHAARPRHLALISAGFLVAGFTLLLLLAVPAGFEALGGQTGLDNVAVVLGGTAQDEASSALTPAVVALVGSLSGVAHNTAGAPVVAPQFIATTSVRRKDGSQVNVLVRGVTSATWGLSATALHWNAGQLPRTGAPEIMAGDTAARSYAGLSPGADIKVRAAPWRVLGTFRGGGLWDSELWTDMSALQATFNATSNVSVLWVKLQSNAAFDEFAQAIKRDPRLSGVRTERQRGYYARQVSFVTSFMRIAALGIAVTLGLGAVFTIANALNLALISRRRELAVLRALGFRQGSLAFALLIEVTLIGFVATMASIVIASIVLNGREIGTSTGEQAVVFALAVTPAVMAWTILYALTLGIASALWPAHQAVRAPLLRTLAGN